MFAGVQRISSVYSMQQSQLHSVVTASRKTAQQLQQVRTLLLLLLSLCYWLLLLLVRALLRNLQCASQQRCAVFC
jgi:hypothetical protein